MLDNRKSTDERLDRVRLPFEDVTHRACRGAGLQPGRLLLDLFPHLRLVRSSDPASQQRLAHLGALGGAARGEVRAGRCGEAARFVAPASGLHAGDRNDDIGGRWDQDREVDGPILFRADEFLPVENQDRELALVQDLDFGNVARLAHFGDMQGAARKRRVEGVVVRLRR